MHQKAPQSTQNLYGGMPPYSLEMVGQGPTRCPAWLVSTSRYTPGKIWDLMLDLLNLFEYKFNKKSLKFTDHMIK